MVLCTCLAVYIVEISKSDTLEIPTALSSLCSLVIFINKLFININTENKHKCSLNSYKNQKLK